MSSIDVLVSFDWPRIAVSEHYVHCLDRSQVVQTRTIWDIQLGLMWRKRATNITIRHSMIVSHVAFSTAQMCKSTVITKLALGKGQLLASNVVRSMSVRVRCTISHSLWTGGSMARAKRAVDSESAHTSDDSAVVVRVRDVAVLDCSVLVAMYLAVCSSSCALVLLPRTCAFGVELTGPTTVVVCAVWSTIHDHVLCLFPLLANAPRTRLRWPGGRMASRCTGRLFRSPLTLTGVTIGKEKGCKLQEAVTAPSCLYWYD